MARKPRAEYDPHPSIQLMADWVESLKDKTGRSLDEWVAHINRHGPADEAARRRWLKEDHGLGTNAASWLAERSLGKAGEQDTQEGYLDAAPRYVEAMYQKRPALRPIHDAIIAAARDLGRDVRVCPCRTIVPLYRRH
jgi:hypothetical protein